MECSPTLSGRNDQNVFMGRSPHSEWNAHLQIMKRRVNFLLLLSLLTLSRTYPLGSAFFIYSICQRTFFKVQASQLTAAINNEL